MANSVDPDETGRYKPYRLILHYLLGYLYRYAVMEGLRNI